MKAIIIPVIRQNPEDFLIRLTTRIKLEERSSFFKYMDGTNYLQPMFAHELIENLKIDTADFLVINGLENPDAIRTVLIWTSPEDKKSKNQLLKIALFVSDLFNLDSIGFLQRIGDTYIQLGFDYIIFYNPTKKDTFRVRSSNKNIPVSADVELIARLVVGSSKIPIKV